MGLSGLLPPWVCRFCWSQYASSGIYAERWTSIKNKIAPAEKTNLTKLSGQLGNGYLAELSAKRVKQFQHTVWSFSQWQELWWSFSQRLKLHSFRWKSRSQVSVLSTELAIAGWNFTRLAGTSMKFQQVTETFRSSQMKLTTIGLASCDR